MIEGLHVDVPAAEVKEAFRRRIEHHTERLAIHRRQLELLREAMGGDAREARGSGRNPIDEQQEKVTEHSDAIAYCSFMHDHLVADETYRLKEGEVFKLGIKGASRY
jgi:hypothetical protein